MYIWNKNNFSRFNNFYGDSMAVILAENPKRAAEIFKENDPDSYKSMQNFWFYVDEAEAWYIDLMKIKYGEDLTKRKMCRDKWSCRVNVDELSYDSYLKGVAHSDPKYYNDIFAYIEQNKVKEDGYTEHAYRPIEKELDQEIYLTSRASD